MTDVVAEVEMENDDDFNAGFSAEPTVTPVRNEQSEEVAQVTESPVVEPDPATEFVQLTRGDLDDLRRKAAVAEELKASQAQALDKVFGKIGGLERVLQQYQSETASGKPVEITEEDVAEISQEFPELGASTLKVLQKVAGKLKGTGGIQQPAFDPKQFDDEVGKRVAVARQEIEHAMEIKLLTSRHDDWEKVAHSPEFNDWLKGQPNNVQDRVNHTWDSLYVAKVMDEFKDYRKKAESNKRQSRIDAAVTPKTMGGVAPGATEDDDFMSGFHARR